MWLKWITIKNNLKKCILTEKLDKPLQRNKKAVRILEKENRIDKLTDT